MKTSLIWRFSLIGLVLAGWIFSIFPLHDRDYLATFKELAAPQLQDAHKRVASVEAKRARLDEQLAGIKDQTSARYQKIEAERAALTAEVEEDEALLERFDVLIAEAEKLLAENPRLAPYMALRDAAKGGDSQHRIRLNRYIKVPTQPRASNALVLSHVRRKAAGKLRLGLDLRGGTEFVIGFDESLVPEERQTSLYWREDVRDQIIEILRNRVDSMGVVEPEIKPTGRSSLSLRMPSVSEGDKADIRRTIKQTAKLQFHLVDPNNEEKVKEYLRDPQSFRPTRGYKYAEMEVEQDGRVETEILFIMARPEPIEGGDVKQAFATFNEFGNYSVSLTFNSRGAGAFAETTSRNVGNRLAIVLDGKVYSAPVIREAIAGGSAQISGSFSPEEARRLAGVIESGNLPVSITIDSEFGTDPTLGADSIRSGTYAAIWGLVAVLIFMVLYYRGAGVVAILALTCNIVLVLGTLTLTGATITLPGIAGIVLTIGMAVDANVLIFERIREELLNGKTIGNALKSGYSRAFITIVDSNLTTLLTGLILYRFGTGPIRGFAVTLSIGIVASMFTALFMTRAIFDFFLYHGRLTKMSMAYFFRQPSFDFLKIKHVALGFSAVLLLISLITAGYRGKSAMSIDFVGGTEVAFQLDGPAPEVGAVRALMEQNGFGDCRVGYKFSAVEQDRLLELVLPERSTNEAALDLDKIGATLSAGFDGVAFRQVQTNSVGGLVGSEFQKKALIAAVLAVIGIIIYISFRFELAYGVASVAALVHDVLIAGGLYLVCGRQLSLPVVAALLTIMGYSLNDTIVVFDRIREDLSLHPDRSYRAIINLSINQTLGRTVLTSLTTLIVVVTLFLFGGGAINDFALVMLIGVIVGTYSSIFIASTIIASWHKRTRRHAAD